MRTVIIIKSFYTNHTKFTPFNKCGHSSFMVV